MERSSLLRSLHLHLHGFSVSPGPRLRDSTRNDYRIRPATVSPSGFWFSFVFKWQEIEPIRSIYEPQVVGFWAVDWLLVSSSWFDYVELLAGSLCRVFFFFLRLLKIAKPRLRRRRERSSPPSQRSMHSRFLAADVRAGTANAFAFCLFFFFFSIHFSIVSPEPFCQALLDCLFPLRSAIVAGANISGCAASRTDFM